MIKGAIFLSPFLFSLSSCSSVDFSSSSFRELCIYQAQKEVHRYAKNQIKEDFEEDITMSYEERIRRNKILGRYFSKPKKEYVLRCDNLYLSNRGNLRLNIKGKKEDKEVYSYGLFKTKSDPVSLKYSGFLHSRFKISLEIQDLQLTFKYRDYELIETWLQWSIRW